jgi:hypothetical protein
MIFTDGSVILCGWEPRKRRGGGGLYGIGGKVEPTDRGDYRLTAAREMLEELFGIMPTAGLIAMVAALPPRRTEMVESYVMIHHALGPGGLPEILRLVRAAGVRSPLYPRGIPRSLEGLLLERQIGGGGGGVLPEMAQLCLLPVVPSRPHISGDLTADIERLARLRKDRAPVENGQQQLNIGPTPATGTGAPRTIGPAAAPASSHS